MIASSGMLPRRPSIAAAGGLVCAAFALWVSFGALTFVDTNDPGAAASYVGLLPPVWWLALSLAIALFVAVVLRPSARVVAPLWLSAVVLLPWLPLRMPLAVFIWTGNVLLWLWTGIAVALAYPLLHDLSLRSSRRIGLKPEVTRHAALAAALAAAAFAFGAWSVAPQHPDGDEPHYLIITQSLLQDHDLKIENNHRQRDYQAYLNRSIKPDFLKRGVDDEIYSIHAPGLSAIVAPAFALLGYAGVLIELVLLGAGASALMWLVAWRATGDVASSWFAWAAFALSIPFFFHATAMFPDGLGAVLSLVAILPLVDARARQPAPLMIVGAALAVLPWLSSRFIATAATAAIVIALRLLAEPSRRSARFVVFCAFFCFPLIGAVGFFAFYQIIYGTPNPSVVYNNVPSMSMSAGTLVRGAPGLLFDQQFGLLPNAPVYACGFAGIALMLSRGSLRLKPNAPDVGRRLALELLFISIPYFLVAASFTSWWGGTTPSARYTAPITPLLALPAAVWFAAAPGLAVRGVGIAALLVSLLMTATVTLVDRGAFLFNFRDGISRIARWLTPVVDLTRAIPSLFQNPAATVWMQTAIWIAALAAAVGVAALLSNRGRAAVTVGFGLALQVATMTAASLVWRSNHASIATPYPAGSAILRTYDPAARQIALEYRPFRRLDKAELLRRIHLANLLSTTSTAESATVTHLPPGVYEITGASNGSGSGHVRIRTDRVSGPIADWDAAAFGASWSRQVTIPLALAGLQIEVDPPARAMLHDISMRAVSVSAPPRDLQHLEARRAVRLGSAVVFFLDGDAWVEPTGAWVGGGSSADFAVAAESPSPLQVFLRNGPVENDVTLESGGWREELRLKPGEERFVGMPPAGHHDAGRPMPLKISASKGFRPADFDPKTEDIRVLGVWIETR